jgi:alkylation response protein AidB-like acyl-CoA dehydrogenase
MLRARIAELDVDAIAFRAALERTGDQVKAGQAHPAVASLLKYYGSELNKRRHELVMAAGGADALEWEGERSHGGQSARDWLRTKANSIEGGTSEIQLNILAKHILKLPGA